MSTSENNQSKKEPLSADYQEVHHKKNAFVVGDRAYMWKNEKGKAIKVWRTVASFDEAEGKLGFEGSAKRVTVRDSSEVKHDNVITVEAWERAFSTCVGQMTAREIRKFREGCVVSYETVDGVLCVVITNSRPKVHTKWYCKHDDGKLVKKENTSVKMNVRWVCREGSDTVVHVANNSRAFIGKNDVIINSNWDWFEQKAKGRPVVWNGEKAKEICEKCPWLLTTIALWKYEGKEMEIQGRPFIDFVLDKKRPVIKNGEGEIKLLTSSEVEEKDVVLETKWWFNSRDWKRFALNAGFKRSICKACPWLLSVESDWYIKDLRAAKHTTGQKVLDWYDGKIKTEDL